MTRDYAKRSSHSHRNQRQRCNTSSNFKMWIFTIVIFILFTLGLAYLGKYRQHHTQTRKLIEEIKVEQQNKKVMQQASKKLGELKELNLSPEIEKIGNAETTLPSTPVTTEHNNKLQFEFTTPESTEEVIKEKTKRDTQSNKTTANKSTNKKEDRNNEQDEEDKEVKKIKKTSNNEDNRDSNETNTEDQNSHKYPQRMQQFWQREQRESTEEQTQETSPTATSPTTSTASQIATTTTKQELYLLEIIEAKNYAMIDRIRARLALMGYEATVITHREQKTVYYRLTLGPYEKNIALAKQRALDKNKMKTTLRKLI